MNENPGTPIDQRLVYEEMYKEARRHRDHEFTSSTWFSALLLGVLGFLIATRFGVGSPAQRAAEFVSNPLVRRCVMVLCIFIALASTLVVWACHRRYVAIRSWLDKYLEPDFKKTFKPAKQFFAPHRIYYATPWFAVATIALILFA